jgi:hypothetical protein
MRAMLLNELKTPLKWTEMPDRLPGPIEGAGVLVPDASV